MGKVLYIKIFQPFAQYRNPYTFYYAQTYPLPPKSTIIGMLQNATNRYYDEKFWNLEVSVHGGFESIFWNYQQLIKGFPYLEKIGGNIYLTGKDKLLLYGKGKKSQRTPVYQQELFNGHLHIFIRLKKSKDNDNLLEEIKEALNNPKKVLSLGRSEDIIFIRKVEFVNKENVEKAKSFKLFYPTYIKQKNLQIKKQKYPVYSVPVKVIFKNKGIPIKNKSEISKNTEREVEYEVVIYTGFDYTITLKEPKEIEEFNIDGLRFRIIKDFGWL